MYWSPEIGWEGFEQRMCHKNTMNTINTARTSTTRLSLSERKRDMNV